MRKIILLTAAMALSAQVASASPFKPTASAGGTGGAESDDRKGVVSLVLDQLSFSLAAITGRAGHSPDGATKYYYSTEDQCTEGETPVETEGEETEAKKSEPVGPEPIYFGF